MRNAISLLVGILCGALSVLAIHMLPISDWGKLILTSALIAGLPLVLVGYVYRK